MNLVQMDVRDKALIDFLLQEKFDTVIHLAAQTLVPFSMEYPLVDADINIKGLINLLEGCRKSGVKRIIFLKNFRYCWYWVKNMVTGFPFAKFQPLRCVEDIVVFYRKKPTYNPQGLVATEKKIHTKSRVMKDDCVYDQKTLNKEYETKYTNWPRQTLTFSWHPPTPARKAARAAKTKKPKPSLPPKAEAEPASDPKQRI